MLKNTDPVPHLAVFSCLASLTLNTSLHHISFDPISMIREEFKLSADTLHVLMSCTLYRFHKSTEASFYDHVLKQLGYPHTQTILQFTRHH